MISRQYISEIRLKRDEVPAFDQYPFSLSAVRHLDVLQLHPAVTFFVGENGSGKSTLLEAIAVSFGFNAEGGSKNFRFGTRESHSELYKFLRISKGIARPHDGFFLRAESFFNVATEIEKLDAEPGPGPPIGPSFGERALHEQSHGESFIALMVNRFHGKAFTSSTNPKPHSPQAANSRSSLASTTSSNKTPNSSSPPIPPSSWPIPTPIFTHFPQAASNASPTRTPNTSASPATSSPTLNACSAI